MRKKAFSVKNMVMCGVFAAVVSALSQISVPLPLGVPITLQTFAAALCGCYLGSLYGTAAIGVYIAVGAVGAPVFASMRGGFGVLLGPTGGFIFGFIPLALLCGIKCGKWYKSAVLCCCGVIACHICGAAQYALIGGLRFNEAVYLVSLPFLPKDFASAVGAFFFARLLKKRVGKET